MLYYIYPHYVTTWTYKFTLCIIYLELTSLAVILAVDKRRYLAEGESQRSILPQVLVHRGLYR